MSGHFLFFCFLIFHFLKALKKYISRIRESPDLEIKKNKVLFASGARHRHASSLALTILGVDGTNTAVSIPIGSSFPTL